MNNYNPPNKPSNNHNSQHNSDEPAEAPSRVSQEHGGDLVEAISPEQITQVNDPNCKHERAVRDFTEKDFIAFQCANPKCGLVVLFNKQPE